MRTSVLSVLFAAALFSECYTSSEAVPTGKTEDAIALEQDALASLLNEEAAAENILVPETAILGRSGGTKIIVVGDAGLWRNMRAMERGLPLYKLRAAAAAAAAAGPEGAMTLDRRDAGQDLSPGVSIVRRDTMRCMVGRVYRPCWEA